MVEIAVSIVLVALYGVAATLHLVLLIPGGTVKAHVNLLVACGHLIMLFASTALFVSDVPTLVNGWFWMFATAATAMHYLALSFYLTTDRTASMGALVCEVFGNATILLVIFNPLIADNTWVRGMVILFGIALTAMSSGISVLYRFRSGLRPTVIILVRLLAYISAVVSVLLSPPILGVGSPTVWNGLLAAGLVVCHIFVGFLCMWYTEANSSLLDMPVIVAWMGMQKQLDLQGGVPVEMMAKEPARQRISFHVSTHTKTVGWNMM